MASSFHKKGSEEEIDFKCSVCYKKNKERKSEKFCRECQKHFCTKCLESHNDINDDHTLQEPSKAAGQVMLPTQRCPKHPEKITDTYCKDHDEVECNTCAFDKHRSCKTVLYIPNEVGQLFKTKELQQARAGLDRVKDRLTKGGRLRERWTETLQTEKEKQLSSVDAFVETLVAIIRYLGKEEKKGLVNKFKIEEDKLQQNTDNCQEVMTDVQKFQSQLDKHDENTAFLFVNIKKSQKIINFADQLFKEVQEITKNQSPQFKSDRQIEQYLKSLQSLGSVVDNSLMRERKQSVVTSTQPPTLYKAGQRQVINIKIKRDKFDCFTWDSCLLPDGSLLLSDFNNQKLKRLDTTTYTVTDHCDLPDRPCGVCCISQQEAAVCLLNNTIQFVSLSPHKMSLTRSFMLNLRCHGVSYWDKKLCLASVQDVMFYTLSGSLIKSENLGLSNINNITFNQSGDVLYIADNDLGLIALDMSGREIFRYSGLGLAGCTSVCVDSCGSVLGGGHMSGNVVQVTERGQPLGVVVPQSAGIKMTVALSFDSVNRRLFVGGESNAMAVIGMK